MQMSCWVNKKWNINVRVRPQRQDHMEESGITELSDPEAGKQVCGVQGDNVHIHASSA